MQVLGRTRHSEDFGQKLLVSFQRMGPQHYQSMYCSSMYCVIISLADVLTFTLTNTDYSAEDLALR